MKFTKAQQEAIEHISSNLQLIACAGSGKTEVVANHVVHLLMNGLVPANIVAFTFTDKAAAELKDRIVTRCREQLGDIHGLAEMFVGTIHSFCLDLLKTEVPEFLKYGVLNEVQQALLVDRHSRESGLTTSTDLAGQPLRRYVDTDRYVQALSVLREARLNEKKLKKCSVVEGLKSYRALLRAQRYLDYTSIMTEAVEALLGDENLRQRLGMRVCHVIVDEYQDNNPIQECIVRIFHDLGALICVVGDDDQTIYQWRGSDVTNILTFAERYPKVKQVRLQENFRSSQGIVETARDFIQQNAERLEKAMIPTDAQPYEVGDVEALSFETPEEEAQFIVQTIQQLRGVSFRDRADAEPRGLSYSDCTVLLRSVRRNGEPIMAALREAGIPAIIVGMNNLFDTAEAAAARALFFFMADRNVDRPALQRAWLDADVGINPKQLDRAIDQLEAAKAEFSSEDQKRWGFYSLQRLFRDFLATAGLREGTVPHSPTGAPRGEVVLYNLGKFSQLITDFEQIHYHSKPEKKYASFADFLEHRAAEAYPEGWQDNQYANPDAVRVMTVHQAKGMQWPVVFVPALLRNRFPAAAVSGRNVWHLIPDDGVVGSARYQGSLEDERRLFYVAMTRAQKFLFLTYAPIPGYRNRYARPSDFWNDVLGSKWVKRRAYDYSKRPRLTPAARAGVENVVLSFSDLKYFFECPYQFKLRVLYGFNPPLHEALGYGKSLHDVLAEVHARALRGDVSGDREVPELVERHLHVPFAYPALRDTLEASAKEVVQRYLAKNRAMFDKLEFSEKGIEIHLADGVSVVGRIDLVRRLDTDEVSIVDLKTSERSQAEDVTENQLHVYALGYHELTGRQADYVEVYELDEQKQKRRSVDQDFIDDVVRNVAKAADTLRKGRLTPKPGKKVCQGCDFKPMCTDGCRVTA